MARNNATEKGGSSSGAPPRTSPRFTKEQAEKDGNVNPTSAARRRAALESRRKHEEEELRNDPEASYSEDETSDVEDVHW